MIRRAVPILLVVLCCSLAFGQTDPGVRTAGGAGAGGALSSVSISATLLNFFNDGKARFQEVDSVRGTLAGEDGVGLGPRFNARSCTSCHAQPATGGSAPATNPQVQDATADGAQNTVPSFITSSGPVREARFPFFFDANGNPDVNNPNGGVEDLFTIAGRVDAPSGCTASVLPQPGFAQAVATGNVIFRIPTPTFGAGLIENIDDATLQTNARSNDGNTLGISGHFNHNGNDGTIARFGWKAQNKSLTIFAGEAYNVEQGVSNELFTQERPLPGEDQRTGLPAACRSNATPEDHTNFSSGTTTGVLSDTVGFAVFMRFLAAPTPNPTTPGGSTSINNGRSLFSAIGCAQCHSPSLTTSASSLTSSLSNATANLFSDLMVHHMGSGLADNVGQGGAGGDEFRSAPLWGLGQRIFFLHDGRTKNLLTAISAHASSGSEANAVVSNFNALSATQKQDVLNFLRSL